MKVRKGKYRNRDGNLVETPRYYVRFSDAIGRRQCTPGYPSRKASEELGRKLERLVAFVSSGLEPDAGLRVWLDSLPDIMQNRLVKMGLIEAQRQAAGRSLAEHIVDYAASQTAAGVSAKHVAQVTKRLLTLFDEANLTGWSQVTGNALLLALDRLRYNDKPLKVETRNHFIAHAKAFGGWMVKAGRTTAAPLAGDLLKKQKITDAVERRAGTVDEIRRLIGAAQQGPAFAWGGGKGAKVQPHSIAGPERALLYRLAVESGLRAGEIRGLRSASFGLQTLPCSVTIAAADAKSGRAATIPIDGELADLIRVHLANKLPSARAFAMPPSATVARMFHRDREAAGIPYLDGKGKRIDFHSLRHHFITKVGETGAAFATIQRLARHAHGSTTEIYLHADDDHVNAAVAALPDYAPAEAYGQATGTDGPATSATPQVATCTDTCPVRAPSQDPLAPRGTLNVDMAAGSRADTETAVGAANRRFSAENSLFPTIQPTDGDSRTRGSTSRR